MLQLTEIDRKETLRYLGWRGTPISPALETQITRCLEKARSLLEPKWIFRRFSLVREPNGIQLTGTNLLLEGNDIAQHLENAQECYLLCVTLGLPIERQIRQSLLTAPEEGVIYDACATAAVEQAADLAEQEISQECATRGKAITWRFSPGYGDLPLALQGPFLSVLDAHRKIGLTVNESQLLTPGKSVTAILGVLDQPKEKKGIACNHCPNRETCAFRKRGEQC